MGGVHPYNHDCVYMDNPRVHPTLTHTRTHQPPPKNSVTAGIDALGEVTVRLEDLSTGKIYYGRSANTDVVVRIVWMDG